MQGIANRMFSVLFQDVAIYFFSCWKPTAHCSVKDCAKKRFQVRFRDVDKRK